MQNNNKIKKIIAIIFIVGGLALIPFLEWPKGEWNEKVPNQYKDKVEQPDQPASQVDGDTIQAVSD